MVKAEWVFTGIVKDIPEYSQIDYIHLVKLKLLLQSMQVLQLFKGNVDGIIPFFNGQKDTRHFLVRLMLKAK